MTTGKSIAVVGVACRLPGAGGPAELWSLLADGRCAVGPLPEDRRASWGAAAAHAQRAGFLDRVDAFDAAFFGISPREAAVMDPQQRLVLELAWEALEDAGRPAGQLAGRGVGVFVGAMWDAFGPVLARAGRVGARHAMTGAHRGTVAHRVSYALDLRGPSVVVDCGQSSSLTAVHLACEELRRGGCGTALAGGVNLMLAPEGTAAATGFGGLSPDGCSYVFDARANGFVRGEGGALVVLKPLDDAVRDGDPVYCVIEGSAVNQDGASSGALTVPSTTAQEAVVRLAHRCAGTERDDVQYVELHGTGTPVGDPVEAAALGAALGTGRTTGPLLVGSVKTNVGHLEGAAGVTGLVKTALSLARGRIPASLHFETPHPRIPLRALGLDVPQALTAWPGGDDGRRKVAGVTSLGMGGTNCHVVLAEAPPSAARPAWCPVFPATAATAPGRATAPRAQAPTGNDTAPALVAWPLSGRGAAALRAQADRLRARIAAEPALDPADVAHALVTAREPLSHRAVVIGRDTTELTDRLTTCTYGERHAGTVTGRTPDEPPGATELAFLFSGQGSQRIGMGRELAATQPVFAAALDEAFAAVDPWLDRPLRDVVFDTGPDAPLHQTGYAQPALFAVEVALHRLMESFGVHPGQVMGHSVGEIAAAHVAGALPLADAGALAAARGRLMQSVRTSGAMAALQATEGEAAELLAGRAASVSLAAVNGPASVVISGDRDAVHELEADWRARGRRTKVLRTSHAFHSPHLDAVLDELRTVVAGLAFSEPDIPVISNVTGRPAAPGQLADPDYWAAHARGTVRFHDGVRTATDAGARVFLELGPDGPLAAMVRESLPTTGLDPRTTGTRPTALAALRRGRPEDETLHTALAELWVRGFGVTWDRGSGGPRQRVALPTYAFQRERHWPEPAGTSVDADEGAGAERVEPEPDTTRPVPDAAPFARRLSELGAGEQSRLALELVRSQAAAVLGHASGSAVAADTSFKKQGFDSLGAAELSERLSTATGLALPATLTFDHPTPRAAADRVRELIAGSPEPAGRDEPRAVDAAEPLAVVAMSCRYPGAQTPEELWDLVAEGRDVIGDFPADRGWDLSRLFDPTTAPRPGTSHTDKGGFLPDADRFDAAFFGISPREALAMDPQQRLLLECAWQTFERAGVINTALRHSSTGVFVGLTAQDYGPRMHEPTDGLDGHLLTGTTPSVAAGRISYALGLEGPAVTVDTACSSSLVAIHLAAQALRAGECSLALAGGVTVLATPGMFGEFSRQGGLAPDGRCKAFAAAADGTGWSEGVGLVLLERLSDARRNGHQVLAVLRGSAVNQDGASNGLAAPNGPSQERVIRRALAQAGLSASEVDAVEAHGTGTKLGDPIEAGALLATYGQGRSARPLLLGSVKSNIGHTQAAAGVAGVIKMVMALRHGVLPASLHIDEPSPHVDWSAGGVRLLTEAVEWARGERVRRAGVSSFGISGTNAHVIVEEAPESVVPEVDGAVGGVVPWVVSGRSAEALGGQAAALAGHVARADVPVGAVGWSLVSGRSVFEHRAVVVGTARDELVAGVEALAEGVAHPGVVVGQAGDLGSGPVLVFPGQGSQWVGMGVELLDSSTVFAERIAACESALKPHVDWSLTGVLRGDGAELARVDVVQPVLWAVMVSLAAVWVEYGVEPAAVIGHSQGEIAAACVAGALTLEDGARIVALRSKALRALSGGGAMASLAVGAEEAEGFFPVQGGVVVAAVNGPSSTVVSGPPQAVAEAVAAVEGAGHRARLIDVDYASHGPQVDEITDELHGLLAGIQPARSGVAFYSTVTAEQVDTTALDTGYWVRNLRERVRFSDAVEALVDAGHGLFVEVSPHPVLAFGLAEVFEGVGVDAVVVPTLRRGSGGLGQLALSLGQAFVAGAPVDWSTWFPAAARRTIDLPTYAFQRQRYWLPPTAGAGRLGAAGLHDVDHPLLPGAVHLADGGFVLTGRVPAGAHGWLGDHTVAGTALVPGAVLVEWALRAADETGCGEVAELTLRQPLAVPTAGDLQVRVSVSTAAADGTRELRVDSRAERDRADGTWNCHATGFLTPGPTAPAPEVAGAWPPAGAEPVDTADFYARLDAAGYSYGDAHHGLRALWRNGDELLAEVVLPHGTGDGENGFGIHPVLLDAALHPVLLPAEPATGGPVWLPFSWSGVTLWAGGAQTVRVRLTPRRPADGDDDQRELSVAVADALGAPVLTAASVVLRPADPGRLRAAAGGAGRLFTLAWTPLARVDGAGGEGWVTLADEGPAAVAEAVSGDAAVVVADVHTGSSSGLVAVERASALVRTWLAEPRTTGARLVLLTRGALPVELSGAPAAPHPAETGIRGRLRHVLSAHPDRVVLLDLEPSTDPPAAAMLDADTSSAVRTALASGEQVVAVRAGRVLAPRWVPDPATGAGEPAVENGGTVLVSGGTGAWGARIAEYLARTGRADRLVLVSRRGPAASDATELAARLAAYGPLVDVVAADLADPDSVAAILTGIDPAHPLTGIVHAAGARSGAPAQVWHAKATVAARLAAAAGEVPTLRRFVVFGEPVAEPDAPNAIDHAAAHAYCEALMAHRHAGGLPGTSVTWARAADPADAPDDAVFDAVWTHRESHVLVAGAGSPLPGAPPHSVAVRVEPTGPRRRAAADGPDRPVDLAARLAALPEGDRQRTLLDVVRGHAAAVLGHAEPEAVPARAAFKQLGFSSLTSVELRDRLSAATGLRLPTAYVFRHPTSEQVTRDLLRRLVPGQEAGTGHVPGADPAVVRADGGNALLNELARLEAAVAGAAVDEGDVAMVTTRLEDLLATWRQAHGNAPAAPAAAADRLKSASAQQVLDFIDNELGVS
ncbi:beta-ketoacyl synthase N-terminal-like domain-containing protein [Streptomyces sp. NPDC017979]|uniref:beta-ketoacyl synthase N-terminal-like domain-containing protein n=1 Tax=Streptomyces sp. NPDC017979 TaxID=3365024 RepID=UPI0037A52DBE